MNKIIYSIIALTIAGLFTFTSCVKQKFDTPPDTSKYDPGLKVTKSIYQIKNMYTGVPTRIDSDYVISGIVTADDRTGGFYKQIVIQDTSSGIVVLLGRASLYTDYPIGRKIYIRCKGLYVGAYGGFLQLGYTPDNTNALSNIPSTLMANFIVKADEGHDITPLKVNVNDLKSFNATSVKWLGTLIQIDSAEFISTDVNAAYAQDPNISSGTDRTIEDCSGKTIVVRMSGYANYRNVLIPAGKGPITAIYSRYNSTAQLLIRDTTDVNMRGTRCGGVVITPPAPITIDSLRHLFTGNINDSSVKVVLGNYKIHGVVTTNLPDSNISKYNLILQDESGKAIVVYYSGSYGYKLGDSLLIDVSGVYLQYYRGSLEVTGTPSKTTVLGTNKSVTPQLVTIAQLNTDFANTTFKNRMYESVLVKVANATIAGTPTTYSGSKTMSDGTGSIVLYTSFAASFAASPCETTAKSYTGIATVYGKYVPQNTNQIQIRKLTDVQ